MNCADVFRRLTPFQVTISFYFSLYSAPFLSMLVCAGVQRLNFAILCVPVSPLLSRRANLLLPQASR